MMKDNTTNNSKDIIINKPTIIKHITKELRNTKHVYHNNEGYLYNMYFILYITTASLIIIQYDLCVSNN